MTHRHITPVGMDAPVTPVPRPTAVPMPQGYAAWLEDLKQRVRTTQFRATRAANAEVIRLYWSIGRDILDRQERLVADELEVHADDGEGVARPERNWSAGCGPIALGACPSPPGQGENVGGSRVVRAQGLD
jgi:hypothetical protein